MTKLTVLMAVFNAEAFVKNAIISILSQTEKDFEFLIINDGSTDSSLSCIGSFNDSRIKILNNVQNLGLIKSLNIGISHSTGEIISRMDADDFAHPQRLEYILKCFNNNPNVMVCSTWFNTSNNNNPVQSRKYNSDEIKALFFFDCAISAASYRRSFFQNNNIRYSEDFPHAEDYELWTRIIFIGDFAIIPKCLLTVTIHQNQVSKKFEFIQRSSMKNALLILLKKIGLNPTSDELNTHFQIAYDLFPYDEVFIEKAENWLKKLSRYNARSKSILSENFDKIISNEWFGILTHLSSNNINTLKYFKNSPLSDRKNIPLILLMKYYYKNFKILVNVR